MIRFSAIMLFGVSAALHLVCIILHKELPGMRRLLRRDALPVRWIKFIFVAISGAVTYSDGSHWYISFDALPPASSKDT